MTHYLGKHNDKFTHVTFPSPLLKVNKFLFLCPLYLMLVLSVIDNVGHETSVSPFKPPYIRI
jgi:hypothetical protein